MTNEELKDFIDIMFSFNEEECKKEYDFIKEYKKLKKENELLKEELKELKDGIEGLFNNMNSLEIINKHEMDDVEML